MKDRIIQACVEHGFKLNFGRRQRTCFHTVIGDTVYLLALRGTRARCWIGIQPSKSVERVEALEACKVSETGTNGIG